MSDSSLVTMQEFERLQRIRKTNEGKRRVNPSDVEFMLDLIDKMQDRAIDEEAPPQIIQYPTTGGGA